MPPMPAYQSEQLQQGAYPHPVPPPAYDVNPPQYPSDVHTGAPYAPSPQHHPQQMHPTVVHSELTILYMTRRDEAIEMNFTTIAAFFPTLSSAVYQPQVGPEPTNMTCPSCRQLITTNLDYEATTKTHLSAVILCLLYESLLNYLFHSIIIMISIIISFRRPFVLGSGPAPGCLTAWTRARMQTITVPTATLTLELIIIKSNCFLFLSCYLLEERVFHMSLNMLYSILYSPPNKTVVRSYCVHNYYCVSSLRVIFGQHFIPIIR